MHIDSGKRGRAAGGRRSEQKRVRGGGGDGGGGSQDNLVLCVVETVTGFADVGPHVGLLDVRSHVEEAIVIYPRHHDRNTMTARE